MAKLRCDCILTSSPGLLVRLVRYGETPLGRMPTQIDYADYREAGGVKIPFRWTLARPSGRFTIQVSEVKQNVPVDDAKFAKPPAPPEEKRERASETGKRARLMRTDRVAALAMVGGSAILMVQEPTGASARENKRCLPE